MDLGRPNSLMRFLGPRGFCFVGIGLCRQVVVTVLGLDILAYGLDGGGSHSRRIGSHVADEPDRTLLIYLHTLIQLLRGPHRALRGKAEPL